MYIYDLLSCGFVNRSGWPCYDRRRVNDPLSAAEAAVSFPIKTLLV